MRFVATSLALLAACGRIGFRPLGEDDDELDGGTGGRTDGNAVAEALCVGDNGRDDNGNGIPDACDPCVGTTACDSFGVPVNGLPTWAETAYVVGLNAIRSDHIGFRDRYMTFNDGSGVVLFSTNPAPVAPMYVHPRLAAGARFHATNRVTCEPGPMTISSLCDGTVYGTWVAAYNPARGGGFARKTNVWSAELPWYHAGGVACGPTRFDFTYDSCLADTDSLRQRLFFDPNTSIGTGIESVVGMNVTFWSLLYDDEPLSFTYPIVTGSHFYFRGQLYFAVNVETTSPPREVHVVIDGSSVGLQLDLGTATRGMFATSMPPGAACRSYYFLLVDDAGMIWRYPGRGQFRTMGEGTCTEAYIP